MDMTERNKGNAEKHLKEGENKTDRRDHDRQTLVVNTAR